MKIWLYAKRHLIVATLPLLLIACGTLEVGLEPEAGSLPRPTATDSSTELEAPPVDESTTQPTPLPTPMVESVEEPTLVPTPTMEPIVEVASPLWLEYRDPRYGYGMAIPCYWVIRPSDPDAAASSPSISSYDEPYFLERSQRGQWADGVWPEGAFKFDIYVQDGVNPDHTLLEAVDTYLAQRPTDSLMVSEISNVEEVTIGVMPAVRVTMEIEGDSPYDMSLPDQYHMFRLAPDLLMLLQVSPRSALEDSEIQAILSSLVIDPNEKVTMPGIAPRGPLEGREVYLNEETGYCFSYPSEYALETYGGSSYPILGEVASLKLERPLHTVGMVVETTQVGEGAQLSQLVDNFLLQFADQTGIERNSPNYYNLSIGGEPAETLVGVPGEPETFDVFALRGGRLVHMRTSPTMESNPQAAADVANLFFVVSVTFSFLN